MKKFLLVVFGITYLMGLLMWYGYAKGCEVSAFPLTQMMYPAAGVISIYCITGKEDDKLPKAFFFTYLFLTIVMVVFTVLSVFIKSEIWSLLANMGVIIGSIACWITLLNSGQEKRRAYGLTGKKGKHSAWYVILFIVLFILRGLVASGLEGELQETAVIFANPGTWLKMVMLCVNFALTFIMFFGEEYGWRYYLQPIMQEKWGKRKGVILLGVVWGLWHLPLNLLYYNRPQYGLISIVQQLITCITFSIFFAYSYMKTENIWVPIILHFLNNNMIAVFSSSESDKVFQNQVLLWNDVVLTFILNGIFFGVFLMAKVFRKKDDV